MGSAVVLLQILFNRLWVLSPGGILMWFIVLELHMITDINSEVFLRSFDVLIVFGV